MILEGAELAGLAELESDLKKYGSLLWGFVVIIHLLEVVICSIAKSFWVWSKKYQNPQRNCNSFFSDRILLLSIQPIRAPSKNWADDWRDEPHNLTIYIFSKYLIGTGQSYRIFHKSLNYDTTLHCCCVVLCCPLVYICIQLQLSRVVTQYCLTSIGSANPPKNWGSQISQVESHKCW